MSAHAGEIPEDAPLDAVCPGFHSKYETKVTTVDNLPWAHPG